MSAELPTSYAAEAIAANMVRFTCQVAGLPATIVGSAADVRPYILMYFEVANKALEATIASANREQDIKAEALRLHALTAVPAVGGEH